MDAHYGCIKKKKKKKIGDLGLLFPSGQSKDCSIKNSMAPKSMITKDCNTKINVFELAIRTAVP